MKYSWVVYILCCSDGKYYTGVTSNIEKRVNAHSAGETSKFTRARLPVKLLATSREEVEGVKGRVGEGQNLFIDLPENVNKKTIC